MILVRALISRRCSAQLLNIFVTPRILHNGHTSASGHLLGKKFNTMVLEYPRPGLCRISSSYHCSFPSSRYFGSDLKTDPSDKAQEPSKENARKSTPLPPDASFRQRTAHLWIRFKEMYRDYWYILVPVHAVTTAMWLGGFYVLAKCGLPLVPLLEAIGTPEWLMEPIRRSNAGYFAVAYALYKVITPARYATTLGCTTYVINYLKLQGKIRPVPSRKEIVDMFRRKTVVFRNKGSDLEKNTKRTSG